MPSNPFMGDGGQNLSQLLMALGSGFSMASAANQPWWAGIGPAAGLYGQAQQQAEDRAYRQQQIEQNNQYRQLQEQALRAQIDAKRADQEAALSYVPSIGMGGQGPAATPGGSPPGMAVPPKPPVMGGGQNVNIPQAATAIGKIEGDYNSVGPVANGQGNRAYGKYQVMDFNIGPWTKEVLGTAMTPEQFLADSGAQDAVFNSKFGAYANKYGPEGAARAWFAGEGGMNNPNAKDVLGTTVASYGRKFADLYGMQNPEAPPESYRGPGTNPLPRPPIAIGGPPPEAPDVAPPPSPVVLTGGQPVPMQPAAPQSNLPPPPEPPNIPPPQLTQQEYANVMAVRRSKGVAEAERLAREYVNSRWEPLKQNADALFKRDMEVWKAKVQDAQWVQDYRMKGEQFADKMKLEREQAAQKAANDPVSRDGAVQQGPIDAKAQEAAAAEKAKREAAAPFAAGEKLTADEMARYSKEIRPGAEATAGSLPNLYEMKRLADGNITTGTLADLRIAGSRVLDTLGLRDMPDGAVNTTEFLNRASKNVLSFLQTRALGSGSGISEGDRKFVEQMGMKDAGYSKQELQRLTSIAIQSAQGELKKHDATVGRLKALPGVDRVGDAYWKIDAPSYDEWAKANPAPTPTAPSVTPPAGAVRALQMNPSLAREFDAKYGAGAADQVLKGRR